MRSTLLALVFLPVALTAQEVDSGRAALLGAAERYASISSLCADFLQQLEVPLLDQTVRSSGRLCQSQPNLFSMRFLDPPDGDVIVGDGEFLWVYYPSLDPTQALKFRMEDAGGEFDFQREFLEDPLSKYDPVYHGSESVDGNVLDEVELIPKASATFVRARLWIDRASRLVHRLEIHQENGSVRRIWLSQIDPDPVLERGTFLFEPPPGVLVILR
jgi:outer membrane lipoprotein-sorting protein